VSVLSASVRKRFVSFDGRNGQPLQKQKVSTSFMRECQYPSQNLPSCHVKTDAQGKVEFELPPPAPLRFSVWVQLTSEHWRCECMALVTTKNLMDTGVDGPGPVHRSTGAGDGPMWVLGRRIGLEIWHGVP